MSALPSRIGAYEVVRLLGKGGMAVVYLGRDPAIDRLVAIKLLRESLDSLELRERFSREAKSAGRLRHPNIVTVFQVGVHDSAPFIVMEYIPGESLAEVIRRQPPLALTWKLRVIEDLCRGLAYAHKAGVVHRDMKPANIQIDLDGGVKILDFGIARLGEQKAGEQALTRLGMMMGTPNYMAPEQINPGTADHRSDVFAVGLVFYELLTYRRAFGGDSYAVLHNILNQEVEPIEQFCPDIDPGVIAIVNRALAKNPDARYQDLGEMRVELKRIRLRLRSHADDGSDEGPVTVGGPSALATDATRLGDRGTEVSRLLSAARSAYESGEFEKAIDLCEQVLKIETSLPDAIELGSLASGQLTLARARDLLAAGQEAYAAGSLDEAAAHIRELEALQLPRDGGSTVQSQLSALARAVTTATERQKTLRERVETARVALANGTLDTAARAIDEALAISPGNRDALALRTEVRAAIDAERSRQRAAEDAVAEARLHAESGRYDKAIALLQQHHPPHPLVTGALEDVRRLQAEAQRRAAEERRRQDHAERAQQTLNAARQAADRGDLADALHQVSAIDFSSPQLTSPALDRVHADVEAFTARCEAGQHLQRAREALAADDLTEAAASLDRARQRDSQHPDTGSIATAIDRARTVHERIDRARAELDRGELDRAERLLAEALTVAPHHREAIQLRDQVRKQIGERAAALQRAADEAISTACQDAERGDFARAISRLQGHHPAHPAVSAALAEIIEQKAAAERRAADQRRRQEHASRCRAALKAARTAADSGDVASALVLIQAIEFDAADVGSPALDTLRTEADALIARWEATEYLETARDELAKGDRNAASAAVARARQRDPGHPDLEEVSAALTAETVFVDRAALGLDSEPDRTMYLARTPGESTQVAAAIDEGLGNDVPPPTLVQSADVAPRTLIEHAEEPADRTVLIRPQVPSPAAPIPPAPRPASPAPAAPVKSGPTATPSRAGATAARTASETPAKRRPGPGPALIAAGAAVVLILVGAIWWATSTSAPEQAETVAVNDPAPSVVAPAPNPGPASAGPDVNNPQPSAGNPPPSAPPAAAPAQPTPTATPTPTPAPGRGTPAVPGRGAAPGRGTVVPSPLPAPPPTQTPVSPGVTSAPQPAPASTPSNTPAASPTPAPTPPPAAATPAGPAPAPVRPPESPVDRPASPPAPDPARDDAAIRDVLAQFTAGYRRLDASAVRRLWPSAPASLQQSFEDVRSYELELQNPQITVRGDTATVVTVRRIRSQPRAGRVQEASLQTTFSLRRTGNTWLVDTIR